MLYYYLVKYKGWKGGVVRNLATTHMLDRIAESFGEKCYEVPVGFKYISSKIDEVDADLAWIDALPGTKIMIKGNHEYWWKSISSVRAILPDTIKAIQNDAIKIDDYVICGTRGWNVPETGKEFLEEDLKIYKRETERLKLTLMFAKNLKQEGDKLVAMMHFPPFGNGEEQTEFTKLFTEYGVDKVVFGHIHGYTNCPLKTTIDGVEYIFTSCDVIHLSHYYMHLFLPPKQLQLHQ
jgi:predicted phosphohydrolase